MTNEMDAMMADGLLKTVRECARRLYGENQIYPCDDVKRMAADNERFRQSLHDMVVQTQEQAQEIDRLRAALREIAKVTYGWEPGVWSDEEARNYFASLFFGAQSKARAALGEA